jgi:hypothetical protein
MGKNILRFVAIMLTAVAMAGGFAHLLALPNKVTLGQEEYWTVQQIYRGWALLGLPIFGALAATSVLALLERRRPKVFLLTLAAALCIGMALVSFFLYTFPANQATASWTMLPDNWEVLRQQWEYSHAAGALLYFVALGALTLSLLVDRRRRNSYRIYHLT